MTDKFGRSPKTGQNVTNVAGVLQEYVNSNFLRKGQAIDMSGQSIVNLGSPRGPMDVVRKKYVNEKFFKRGDPIGMENNPFKNVLSPTKEGDVATKGYIDSKSADKSNLDIFIFIYLFFDNLATGGSLTCAILSCHFELSKYSTSKFQKKET